MKELAYVSLKLPSNGKLDYVDSVEIRSLTGADEERLAEAASEAFLITLHEILANTIKGVNFNTLSLGDMQQIKVWHASHSFDDAYTAELACSMCDKTFLHEYRLSDFGMTLLEQEVPDSYKLLLSNGENVFINLLRVTDYIANLKRKAAGESCYLHLIAASLTNTQRDIEERIEYLRSLNRKDVALIAAHQSTHTHGPNLMSSCACTHCGAIWNFTAPFRFEELFTFDLLAG